ncbi:MAG TPA: metallophosphoesterase family protein [Longimicrobiales bacterium]|nr:metallophosphoesterase family protein [Longimicrobiales bacterium]
MLTLLHVSDLHFGPPFSEEVGEALLDIAHELDPEVVVASGDFTQRAKPEQFAQARAFLDRLPGEDLVVVPGNHDVPLYRIWERVFAPLRNYQEYICQDLDWALVRDDAVIVALDSTSPLRAITNGRISDAQLRFCEDTLKHAPDGAARIVVAHHHFAPAPDYEGGEVMPNAQRALDAFTSLRVDLILGGHLHRAYIGNSLDVYSGRDREHGIIIVQSGTSTSRRGRAREVEKNSLNLVRVQGDVVRVTHFMYFDDTRGFAPISRHIFPRPGLQFFRDREEVEGSFSRWRPGPTEP